MLPIFVLLTQSACGASADPPPGADGLASTISVLDADGRRVVLPGPAERVVSLIPSATSTLRAIGAEGTLVARTDYDTASWAAELPSVGGGLQPSLEAIVSVRPDLVVRFGGSQDPETPARLDDLGIPHVAVRPDGIDDVLEIARTLGRVTGRAPAGDSLAAALRSDLDEVRGSRQGAEPILVAYVLGGDPPWVAGPNTYIAELIELAGGINVFDDLGRLYASVSPEELVARDIDVILVPRGSTFDRRLARGRPVVEMSDALEVPGPAVAEAAREVARALEGAAR